MAEDKRNEDFYNLSGVDNETFSKVFLRHNCPPEQEWVGQSWAFEVFGLKIVFPKKKQVSSSDI